MDVNFNRKQILTGALDAREQEVMHYQINIDNYTLALGEIANLPAHEREELNEFAGHLRGLLASEILEQKKSKIMLSVIKKQVE
jgi:hypothetical protein